MRPVTKTHLDARLLTGCDDPNCRSHHEHAPLNHLFLVPKCHPHSGVVAIYHRGGVLAIHCITCRQSVVSLAIAP